MSDVKFYDTIEDELLKFAVIVSKTNGKWVLCKHKERSTYEIPGGHREIGETMLETAKRELYEETGATDFTITPVCAYSTKAHCRSDTERYFEYRNQRIIERQIQRKALCAEI